MSFRISTVVLLLSFATIFSALASELVGTPISVSQPADKFAVPSFVIKYAPLLYLHSTDPYKPSDIETHLRHTTPLLEFAPVPQSSSLPTLHLSNLALLNSHGGAKVYLTSNDNVTREPQAHWLLGQPPDASGKIHDATPCVVIVVEKSRRDVDAFYFYFYSYDQGANITMVLPPLDRLIIDTSGGKHFGDHVGDWEHNMVRFRDGKPTGIYFSQHASGYALNWDDRDLEKKGERPIVFSAWGSHANYPSEGTHIHDSALLDYCAKGPTWDPILSAYFYRYHPSNDTFVPFPPPFPSTRDPSNPSAPYPTSYLHFSGLWGDARYPDSDARQKTVPYFGLKRFLSGPTGPKFKQLDRKGLLPVRERKPLMGYAVTAYMKLYGCCLKGVDAWVVVVCLAVSLLMFGFGIRMAVKGCRRWRRGKGKGKHRGWRCGKGRGRGKREGATGEEGYELLGMHDRNEEGHEAVQ